MKFVFYTNSISPHQLPLANELVGLLGEENYRYIYHDELSTERKDLGWENKNSDVWCKHGDDKAVRLENPEILMSGIRALDVFESRGKENKKTFYCSERWFKPTIGFLRIFVPSYFKMARRIVKLLNESEKFYYLPMGIHAARDMARLCGFMNGDWKCLFRAPKLDFERKPGGEIWASDAQRNVQNSRKYCLDKMRMWGYYVSPSEFDALPVKEASKSKCREVKVLWVGRLLNLKRVDTIVRAVGEHANLKRVDNLLPKITLDIYGIGPEEAKLKKLAVKYGDKIKFHPPVPINEVRKLMRERDVYVLSSNGYEGWGAVVSEALEEGMAVIGTYEAGASATILPESNLFHAGDWRRLKMLLERNVEKVGMGPWMAKSAAEFLITQRWGVVFNAEGAEEQSGRGG